ncbi:hypothetical protein DCC81_00010 [Chitinophaga parva]|uniref:Uncharacterized protein n=1 Tax=Chitinophaga parva TaxID=2169414 RepID=A0A2T7BJS2_9BACT|nr:hypothetical protein DCC81_00010 [Chitinophaga parva]
MEKPPTFASRFDRKHGYRKLFTILQFLLFYDSSNTLKLAPMLSFNGSLMKERRMKKSLEKIW